MKNNLPKKHPKKQIENKKNLSQKYTLSNKENLPKVTKVLFGHLKIFFVSDETQQNHFSLLQKPPNVLQKQT